MNLDVYVDESGNLGHGRGRYLTIGLVVCEQEYSKKLSRHVKRQAKKFKDHYPNRVWENGEVKASELTKAERAEMLGVIGRCEVEIFDITVDKDTIQDRMFENKAVSYNYWLKLAVDCLIKRYGELEAVSFHIDRRTIRVKSLNSFLDYITIHLLYECGFTKTVITADYPESHTNYGIQAADFVSNAVNLYHLNGNSIPVDAIRAKIIDEEHFPSRYFGK